MRRRAKGQPLVEMALMLPLVFLILFGIIDLSYYIYGYATIYQAARNGTEKAMNLPPQQSKISPIDTSDDCVNAILRATEQGAVLFPDIANSVQIAYPDNNTRAIGSPIQ